MNDNVTINLKFEDGSFGSIHYLATGSRSFPKERIEVFCDGGIIQLENYVKMRGYDWEGFNKLNLYRQNKGHEEEINKFISSIENGLDAPIPLQDILDVSEISIKISESL